MMDKSARISRALKNLEGVDAAPKLRQFASEIREEVVAGRRRVEVDGVAGELVLDVPVLLVEKANGAWTCETTSTIFPGQREHFATIDFSERLAVAEMRWRLTEAMVQSSFAREPQARKLALAANIHVVGRVPFVRIVVAQ